VDVTQAYDPATLPTPLTTEQQSRVFDTFVNHPLAEGACAVCDRLQLLTATSEIVMDDGGLPLLQVLRERESGDPARLPPALRRQYRIEGDRSLAPFLLSPAGIVSEADGESPTVLRVCAECLGSLKPPQHMPRNAIANGLAPGRRCRLSWPISPTRSGR